MLINNYTDDDNAYNDNDHKGIGLILIKITISESILIIINADNDANAPKCHITTLNLQMY